MAVKARQETLVVVRSFYRDVFLAGLQWTARGRSEYLNHQWGSFQLSKSSERSEGTKDLGK